MPVKAEVKLNGVNEVNGVNGVNGVKTVPLPTNA